MKAVSYTHLTTDWEQLYPSLNKATAFATLSSSLTSVCKSNWKDRIRALADLVPCHNPHWQELFYRWFLGMVAHWRGMDRQHGNNTSDVYKRQELAVVDADIRIDGTGDLNADETAAATGVGQQVLLIAGAYEGGIPPHLTDGAAVGFAQVGSRFLQQMLQEALLVDVDLIELVNVDEQKASQTAFCFLPALEVDAVRIAETQDVYKRQATTVATPTNCPASAPPARALTCATAASARKK